MYQLKRKYCLSMNKITMNNDNFVEDQWVHFKKGNKNYETVQFVLALVIYTRFIEIFVFEIFSLHILCIFAII